jgi:hypothetical protein
VKNESLDEVGIIFGRWREGEEREREVILWV